MSERKLAEPVEATEQALHEIGEAVDMGTLAVLNKSEIDQQIATARQYPRSVQRFRKEALGLVTLTEGIARECVYAIPRDGKVIEGPSIRFAEILFSCWGNCRSAARIVDEGASTVTAQGLFHDLQSNSAMAVDIKRRILDKRGRRYSADMIGVTSNAASSIALRNAILRGVPKALWQDLYEAARKTIMGDFKTLKNRRADALAAFQPYGISPEQIFRRLELRGIDDVGMEHLVVLTGMLTAIKDGDTTPEELFADEAAPTTITHSVKEAATGSAGAAATKAEKPAETSTARPEGTTAGHPSPAGAPGAAGEGAATSAAASPAPTKTAAPLAAPLAEPTPPPKVPLNGAAGLPNLFGDE